MVEVRDLGIGKLKDELSALARLRVKAGVVGPDAEAIHPDADVSIATIAHWLEYGTRNQPARPFLRTGLEKHASDIHEKLRSAVSDLIDGRADSARAAMEGVSSETLKRLLDHFDRAREWAEPLAESTIAKKGHDQPLIDTGTVREALKALIVEEGP